MSRSYDSWKLSSGREDEYEERTDEELMELRIQEEEAAEMKFEQMRDDLFDKEIEIARNLKDESRATDTSSHEIYGKAADSAGRGEHDGKDHLIFDPTRRLEDMWRREPKDSGS